MKMYKVQEYLTESGESPFADWFDSLDGAVKARIQARIFRFEKGLIGDCKSVGDGVYEARFHFGSGYRVYFGIDGGHLILLLIGGDKSTQRKDIKNAHAYWLDYLED